MTNTSSVLSLVDHMQHLIPIATLDPSQPPPSSTIHAEVSLIWPYSSSTKRAALLLGEPDFRARRNNGQIRVQLRGPAAEAVAASHISIGDIIYISLEGASWSEERSAVGVPGRHVDGELLLDRRLKLKIVRNGEDTGLIDVDEPASPRRSASPQASELPFSDSLATPSAAVTWSSPAFVRQKEALLRSAVGPAVSPRPDLLALSTSDLIDEELDNDKPRKRTKFGRKSGEWTFRREEEQEDLDTTEHDTMGSFDVELLDREIREEEVREKQALLRKSQKGHKVVSPGFADFGLDGSAASRPYVSPEQFDQIIEESLFGYSRASSRNVEYTAQELPPIPAATEAQYEDRAELDQLRDTSSQQQSDTQLAIDRQIMTEQQFETIGDNVIEADAAVHEGHDDDDEPTSREKTEPEGSGTLEQGLPRKSETEIRGLETRLVESERAGDDAEQQHVDVSEDTEPAQGSETSEAVAKPDHEAVEQEVKATADLHREGPDDEQQAVQSRDDDQSVTGHEAAEEDQAAQKQAWIDLQIPAAEEVSEEERRPEDQSGVGTQSTSVQGTTKDEQNIEIQTMMDEQQADPEKQMLEDQQSAESDNEDDNEDDEEDEDNDVQEISQSAVSNLGIETGNLQQDAVMADNESSQEQSVLGNDSGKGHAADEPIQLSQAELIPEVEDDSVAVEIDDIRTEERPRAPSQSLDSSPIQDTTEQEIEKAGNSSSNPSSPLVVDVDDNDSISRTEVPSQSQLEGLHEESTLDVVDTFMVVKGSDSNLQDMSHTADQILSSTQTEDAVEEEAVEEEQEDVKQMSPMVIDVEANEGNDPQDEPPQLQVENDNISIFAEVDASTIENENRGAYSRISSTHTEDDVEEEADEAPESRATKMMPADESTILQEESSQLQATQAELAHDFDDTSMFVEVKPGDIEEEPKPQLEQTNPIVIEDDSSSQAVTEQADEDVVMAEDTSLMRDDTSLLRAHRPRSSSVEIEDQEQGSSAAKAPTAITETASADDIAAMLLRDAHADQEHIERMQEESSSSFPADAYNQVRQFASQASTLEVVSTDTALQVDLTTIALDTDASSTKRTPTASSVADALLSIGSFASDDTAADPNAANSNFMETMEIINEHVSDAGIASQGSQGNQEVQETTQSTPVNEPMAEAVDKQSDSNNKEQESPKDEERLIEKVGFTESHSLPDHNQELEIDHEASEVVDESEEQVEEVASYLLGVLEQSMGSAGRSEKVSSELEGAIDLTQDSPGSAALEDVPSPAELPPKKHLEVESVHQDEEMAEEELDDVPALPAAPDLHEVLVSATPAQSQQASQHKEMVSVLGDETLRVLEAHADVTVADDHVAIEHTEHQLASAAPTAKRDLVEVHEDQILAETPLTRKSIGSRQAISRRKSTGRKSDVPAELRGWFSPREDDEPEHDTETSLLAQTADDVSVMRETRSQLAFQVDPESIGRPTKKVDLTPELVPAAAVAAEVVPEQQNQDVEHPKQSKQRVRSSETGPNAQAEGLHTALSYFTPLSNISLHLNSQSEHDRNVDVLAVVSSFASKPKRSTAGPKDHFTTLHVIGPPNNDDVVSPTQVQIFRPRKEHLPLADVGDVVLLRNFVVRSTKGKCFLLSTASSAWCVWRMVGDREKPTKDCRGPPVETGSEEEQRAGDLRKWWMATMRQEPSDAEDELSQHGVDELGVTGSTTKVKL